MRRPQSRATEPEAARAELGLRAVGTYALQASRHHKQLGGSALVECTVEEQELGREERARGCPQRRAGELQLPQSSDRQNADGQQLERSVQVGEQLSTRKRQGNRHAR